MFFTSKFDRIFYRVFTVVLTVFVLVGPSYLVAGTFIAAVLIGAIELLERLQVKRVLRISLLIANALIIFGAVQGLMTTEALAVLLVAVDAVCLAIGIKVSIEDKYNAVLLIGSASLGIIGLVVVETFQLVFSPTTHMPRLQECIFLIALQDFFASVCGRLWPCGRLAPLISPKKTWSGAVFGLVGGVAAWLALQAIVGSNFSVWQALAILVAGIFGDLLFSSIKRSLLVKDFSNILGFKGGMLDRIDSIILALLVTHAVSS